MTIVAGDENNRSEDKENEVVHMVTISDRNNNTLGPQKFDVLLKHSEIKLTTDVLVTLPFRI